MKILKRNKYTILKTILKYSFVAIILFSLFSSALFIQADSSTSDTTPPALKIETKINNPLGEKLKDIPSFIEAIIQIVLVVGVPIVTLAIIYSGFLFVQAQGKPEDLTKAKKALLYTLIGAALLLGAWILSEAIVETVDDIKRTT